MIIGFDVCHDKQNKNRSYGALVATMNDSHTSYFSCVQPHESGQEISSYFATSIASKYMIILFILKLIEEIIQLSIYGPGLLNHLMA